MESQHWQGGEGWMPGLGVSRLNLKASSLKPSQNKMSPGMVAQTLQSALKNRGLPNL